MSYLFSKKILDTTESGAAMVPFLFPMASIFAAPLHCRYHSPKRLVPPSSSVFDAATNLCLSILSLA